MDEQVVPSFPPTSRSTGDAALPIAHTAPSGKPISAVPKSVPSSKSSSSTTLRGSETSSSHHAVPCAHRAPDAPKRALPKLRSKPAGKPLKALQKPAKQYAGRGTPPSSAAASEYPGKLRWQTPARTGTWLERWQSARELGTKHSIGESHALSIPSVLRTVLSSAIVSYVGPHLPRTTVDRWLCLLAEYLELNADEQVLLICLLRRYSRHGGRFIGRGDWARPQRWECAVAIACYLAVLLTEEFPGRTALDLKELLGPNFRFGVEQIAFLQTVDWQISISPEEVCDVKQTAEAAVRGEADAHAKMRNWFPVRKGDSTGGVDAAAAPEMSDSKTADIKKDDAMVGATGVIVDASAKAVPEALQKGMAAAEAATIVGKKRNYAAIAPADDSVVPRYMAVRRMDATTAAAAAAYAQVHAQHMHAHALGGMSAVPAGSFVPTMSQIHAGMNGINGVPCVSVQNVPAVPSVSGVPGLGGIAAQWRPHW